MKLFLSTREKSYSPIYSWPPLDCMLLLPNYYGIQSWPKFKFNVQHPSFVFNIQDLMWTSHLTDSVTPGDLEVVYTKTEDAIDGVFWLATQTPPILIAHPWKTHAGFVPKNMVMVARITELKSHFCAMRSLSLFLYILIQHFTSVLVVSNWKLPPPLQLNQYPSPATSTLENSF